MTSPRRSANKVDLPAPFGANQSDPVAAIDLERHVVEERPILCNYQHSSINSVKERGSHGALRSQLFQSALRKARSVPSFDCLAQRLPRDQTSLHARIDIFSGRRQWRLRLERSRKQTLNV